MADSERYELYYSGKLWSLLPELYRAEDSTSVDQVGPLRELIGRIAGQVAVVRRAMDRLWEDQSIETCDDWAIPYIADLLATNLVPSLDARGQRLDVAKTIYYRRRKGTVALLEELASDITGWDARVVEFFRRMGRTRHGLDPAIGLPVGQQYPDKVQKAEGLVGAYTHTAMGGWADLRNRYGAAKAHSAFDEYFHTADFRVGHGRTGWYNIPRIGVFFWRLKSFGLSQTTPVPVQGCTDWYTFDPTGRNVPLFCRPSRFLDRQFGDQWVSPEEWQLPAPVTDDLLSSFPQQLNSSDPAEARSFGVFTHPGVAGYQLVDPANVIVRPELGRFHVKNPPVTQTVFGVYHYGFSSTIGAGPYDRRDRESPVLPGPVAAISGGGALNAAPAGTSRVDDSLTYNSAANLAAITKAAIISRNEERPAIRLAPGATWTFTGGVGAELLLDGLLISGGDIILRGEFDSVTLRCCTLDPGTSGSPTTTLFETSADGRPLRPVTLWVEGLVRRLTVVRSIVGPLRTRHNGIIGQLTVSESIQQAIATASGSVLAAADIKDSTRLAMRLRGALTTLAKDLTNTFPAALNAALAAYDGKQPPSASLLGDLISGLNAVINGPALYNAARFASIPLKPATVALKNTNPGGAQLARLNRLLLEDAFPLEIADTAVGMADGHTSLSRVTVLGPMNVHSLEASECVLDDVVFTEDPQRGCVRFTAWTTGSILPKKYESVEIPAAAPIFTTRRYGQPGYCQLLESADSAILAPVDGSIREGAQDGSEMGAFWRERNRVKERSLRIKYDEFLPLGLIPVVIPVT